MVVDGQDKVSTFLGVGTNIIAYLVIDRTEFKWTCFFSCEVVWSRVEKRLPQEGTRKMIESVEGKDRKQHTVSGLDKNTRH